MSKVIGLFVLMASVVGLYASNSQACSSCSVRATYQELCAQQFVDADYSEGDTSFADLCAPIKSQAALSCVKGLIRNSYDDIDQDIMNACSWTTPCGATSINAMTDNRYSNLTYDLIKAVASAHSQYQANCMAKVFREGYSNITADNIIGLCP